MKIVKKTWGEEQYLIETPRYVLKRMLVRPGYHSSYHKHSDRHMESWYVEKGRLRVQWGTPDVRHSETLVPGQHVTITAGAWHSFGSDYGCAFLEVAASDGALDTQRDPTRLSGPYEEDPEATSPSEADTAS